MSDSKFDTKAARVIAAQLYVLKGLCKNPKKHIKFIVDNRDYFPNISDSMIEQLKNEHSVTDEDISSQPSVSLASISAEDKFSEDLLKKAEMIEKQRRTQQRNHRGDNKESTIYNNQL